MVRRGGNDPGSDQATLVTSKTIECLHLVHVVIAGADVVEGGG